MRHLLLLLIFLYSCASLHAQDLTAAASRSQVGIGDQFQLTFSLNGNGQGFQPPAFNDFLVLSGPGQSTSMQFINGNISQSISFTYILQAKNEGTFRIGSASIEAGGKRVQSNPITITVTKGSQRAQQPGQSSQQADATADLNSQIAENLFLKVSANKTQVFKGEEIVVVYKLFIRVTLVDFALSKMPSLNGFWSQDIEMPKQLEIHREVLDGVAYNVADIRKVVLYPQQTGVLELDPMEAECLVRVQTKRRPQSAWEELFSDPFSSFGSQNVKFLAKSKSLKINVKELPSQNVPAGFTGSVGKFSMEASLDKSEINANDASTLKIKISGRGNIKLLNLPKVNLPAGVETYDPKITDKQSVTESGISGTKTAEYLMIPRHGGEYKIEPFTFSYFDIEKKEYVTIPSSGFTIKVAKEAGEENTTAVTGVSKEDVVLLGQDIRFIKTRTELRKKNEYFFESPLYYTAAASPLLLLFLLLLYRKRAEALASNIELVKYRKANKAATRRLYHAKKLLGTGDKEKFYEEVSRALWGYASDKLNIALSDLSKERAAEELTKKNITPEHMGQFIDVIDRCEFARFAPAGDSSARDQMYSDAAEIIIKLEQEL